MRFINIFILIYIKVKLPESCEDLFYQYEVNTDNWQNIYPDGKTKTKQYCRNSKLTDGKSNQ